MSLYGASRTQKKAEGLSGTARPSSVHTLALSQQVLGIIEESDFSSRKKWLEAIREETRLGREAIAIRHDRLGDEAIKATTRVWHYARADGQRERFDRLSMCGGETIAIKCSGCDGDRKRMPVYCRNARICLECRGRRARYERMRFEQNRWHALELMRIAGLLRREYGVSEKFLTLTIPHSGDVNFDVGAIQRAWPRFRRQLSAHLHHDRGWTVADIRLLPFYRVIEQTPGTHEDGHAHLHAWMPLPYIPQPYLAHLWGKSLRQSGVRVPEISREQALEGGTTTLAKRQLDKWLVTRRGVHGRELEEVHRPIVDVRKCHGNPGKELVKYLVKDAAQTEAGTLEYADPKVFSACYLAMEGRRMIVASRGFRMNRKAPEHQCERCGCVGDWYVRKVHTKSENPATGPPSDPEGGPFGANEGRNCA